MTCVTTDVDLRDPCRGVLRRCMGSDVGRKSSSSRSVGRGTLAVKALSDET